MDEVRTFEYAFDSSDARCVHSFVGAEIGRVSGVRGSAVVDCTFAEFDRADFVVVPGAIGSVAAAHDEQVVAWLRRAVATARSVLTSSTGSVVLAGTGLLVGRSATTHWLASNELESLGAAASVDRLSWIGNVITCSGEATIVAAVRRAIESLAEAPAPLAPSGQHTNPWQRPHHDATR